MWIDPLVTHIEAKSARGGVISLGYVGLPLATEFARARLRTVGIGVDPARLAAVIRGESYIGYIPLAETGALVAEGVVGATTDFDALHEADCVKVWMPRPLRKAKDQDISYVLAASSTRSPRGSMREC